jgi:hypothetical protein
MSYNNSSRVGYGGGYNVPDNPAPRPAQQSQPPLPTSRTDKTDRTEENPIYARNPSRNIAARLFGSIKGKLENRHRNSRQEEDSSSLTPVVQSTTDAMHETVSATTADPYFYDSDDSNDFGGHGAATPPADPNLENFAPLGTSRFYDLDQIQAKEVNFINHESTCVISGNTLDKDKDMVIVLKASRTSDNLVDGFYDFRHLLHEIQTSDDPRHPITRDRLTLQDLDGVAIRVG